MIDSILRNLVKNSIKYTTQRGEIILEAEQKGDFTQISISDTGKGMPKEMTYSLFNLNNLNSEPGTEGEVGTGLGLQIVKEYVTIHGGNIWVESEIKKGTKVFFTLPNKSKQ